jgi:NADH-quinone oxidoreductase subunit N
MGALVGVLMLVGIASLVLATGATSYPDVAEALPTAPAPLVAVGVLGVLAGVGFKAGAVPMHFWLPDVTAGTTPAMAAYITTIPKIGAVAAAFRLVAEPFATSTLNVTLLVAVIAVASMTLGNLAAFNQTEVLRLLAYSSISQVGYLFMVVAVAARSDLGVPALATYLAGYAVTNVGAFAAAAAASQARTLTDWATTMRGQRWLVAGLVVCLLGLVGTPPTAVFVGKLAVFSAAWDGGLAWLVVIAAINTVASLFYYLRWIAAGAQPDPDRPDPQDAPNGGGIAVDQQVLRGPMTTVYIAAVMSVLLGIGSSVWLTVALPR